MENRLKLHVPALNELWYRQHLMQDPDTMKYNRGYDLSFEGYDRETGCIAFPDSVWAGWHRFFIGQEPERFYAYIQRTQDGRFVGEVNVHRNGGAYWHEMGVVVEAKYRGLGYGTEALELLLRHAFEELHSEAVHNDFESDRDHAVRMHLAAGFTEYRREGDQLELLITREQWLQRKHS